MFKDEHIQEFNYWMEKQNTAKAFMEERKDLKKVLIEVAAQHPLVDGLYPNEEFSKRLEFGIELYHKLLKEDMQVEFYIPGSLHQYNGVADKIELSEAGRKYLLERGISDEIIHGKDLNDKYMCELGVYNSADECYVASHYFKDNDFGKLYSVVSPAQMYRKTLFYIEFGVYPLNFTAPTNESFHNYINEMFWALPSVLLEDHSWQGKNSKYAVETRIERNPNLDCKNPFE